MTPSELANLLEALLESRTAVQRGPHNAEFFSAYSVRIRREHDEIAAARYYTALKEYLEESKS